MKVTPIIMSAPMVRALLEGRKSQTRRIINPQPSFIESSGRWKWPIPKRAQREGCDTHCYTASREWHEYMPDGCCPFGKPGGLLWVRETCAFQWPEHCDNGLIYSDDPEYGRPIRREECDVIYRATDEGKTEWMGEDGEPCPPMWVPSIFMPRFASRLTLELSGVRVERLQDISEEDALAEGIYRLDHTEEMAEASQRLKWPQRFYAQLWESLHGPGSWDANPWVWVLSFHIHKLNVDTLLAKGIAA
jgi:hypothetical protein